MSSRQGCQGLGRPAPCGPCRSGPASSPGLPRAGCGTVLATQAGFQVMGEAEVPVRVWPPCPQWIPGPCPRWAPLEWGSGRLPPSGVPGRLSQNGRLLAAPLCARGLGAWCWPPMPAGTRLAHRCLASGSLAWGRPQAPALRLSAPAPRRPSRPALSGPLCSPHPRRALGPHHLPQTPLGHPQPEPCAAKPGAGSEPKCTCESPCAPVSTPEPVALHPVPSSLSCARLLCQPRALGVGVLAEGTVRGQCGRTGRPSPVGVWGRGRVGARFSPLWGRLGQAG